MTHLETSVHKSAASAASARAGAPLIEVEDLEVAYHVYGAAPNRAIRGITLQIPPGQILGLVGIRVRESRRWRAR